MTGTAPDDQRLRFERIVARTARRRHPPGEVRRVLARQLAFQREPRDDGLDELASVLSRWLGGERDLRPAATVAAAHPAQPLAHLYAFAMRREAGDLDGAWESIATLRALDPDDPMAAQLAAGLEGRGVPVASEETRLANIAALAATPVLGNPYRLATRAIFETIRGRDAARVLDVGVGSGAQLAELLGLLSLEGHRLRRLELVGLDFVDEFLERAGRRIADAQAGGDVEVVYVPVRGRVERLDDARIREIAGGGVDVANGTIALHEVPGEHKLAALRNLRRIRPAHLLIAEWNYRLENTLPETSVEFLLAARSVAADLVAALSDLRGHPDARRIVGDWLSQGGGQLTCPAAQRQECFLEVGAWRALVAHAGFRLARCPDSWLAHGDHGGLATLEDGGAWIATSRPNGWPPIALLHAVT